jgi:hypothetical protein
VRFINNEMARPGDGTHNCYFVKPANDEEKKEFPSIALG